MKALMLGLLFVTAIAQSKENHRVIRFTETKVVNHIKEDKKLDLDVINNNQKKEELKNRILYRSRK
jgi:hypothetical protein